MPVFTPPSPSPFISFKLPIFCNNKCNQIRTGRQGIERALTAAPCFHRKQTTQAGDLIEIYKILTGKENIDYTQFFTLTPTHHNTRGQPAIVCLQKYSQTQTEVLQSEGGQRLEWSSSVSRGCFIRQLVQESARQILERLKLRLTSLTSSSIYKY